MYKQDQKYLLTLAFCAAFLDKKVTVVKALRQLFNLSLRDAKTVTDNFICAYNNEFDQFSFNISLIVNAEQLGTAMALLMLEKQYQGQLTNEDGSTYKCKVFCYSNVEILEGPHAFDISVLNNPTTINI